MREPVAVDAPVRTSARLRGRCVAAEDLRPLAGCVVEVQDEKTWSCTTGNDGVFALDFSPAQGEFMLALRAEGRAPQQGWMSPIAAGRTEDLGDVPLHRGFTVRGRVQETDGRGTGGVTVVVFASSHAPGSLGTGVSVSEPTDDEGNFTIEPDLPAGTWRPTVLGRSLRGDSAFKVDPFTGAGPVVLVVEPFGNTAIAGIVVDDADQPVAGVMLTTTASDARDHTGENGRFQLQATSSKEPRAVIVAVPGRCEPDPTPHPVLPDTTDLRIVLRRARSLTVAVVDDRGAPVRSFGVWLGLEANLQREEQFSRAHGDHEDGRAVVEPARRGRNLLRVFPHAADLLASKAQPIDVGDGELPPVRVVLARLPACPVEVIGPDGAAVQGATVKLVQMRGEVRDSLGEVRNGRASAPWLPRSRTPELVSQDVTDQGGRAKVFAPADLGGLLLRVEHDRFTPFHQPAPPLSPMTPMRVVLAAPGAIAGKVDLHGQQRSAFAIQLTAPDASEVALGDEGITPQADGSFAIERLLPGTYTIRLGRLVEWSDGGTAAYQHVPLAATSRRVGVTAGATTAVAIDAPLPAFATLNGRLLVEGAAAAGWRVDLVMANGARRGAFPVAGDGTFTADELLPGPWQVHLRPPHLPADALGAQLAETVDLQPGAVLVRDFHLVPRRLLLRLRHPDGSPVSAAWDVRCGGRARSGRGDCLLDPAPELPVEFRLCGADTAWSAPVAMPQDRREWTAEVIVPAAAR